MRKIIILLLLATICHAQSYRFTYDNMMRSTKESQPLHYTMFMDIVKDTVKYYDAVNLDKNFHKPTFSYQQIVRKIGSNQNTLYTYNPDRIYYKIETADNINWKLEKDTKVADEYKLKKAVTSFGGRNWIAWYTEDIPFSQGPYKFQGLPGLIVELQDEQGLILYKLIKTEKISSPTNTYSFLESYNNVKAKKSSLADFQKSFLTFYNDPIAENRAMLQSSGLSIKDIEQQKLQIQQKIRETFIQIELDKAMPFPSVQN